VQDVLISAKAQSMLEKTKCRL